MPHRQQRLRKRLSGDRGSSTVEFLFITPLVFLVLLVLVQFAMYGFASEVAQAAAQAGARKARETADANPGSWQGFATQTATNRIESLGPQLVNGAASAQINPIHDGDQVGLTVTAQVVSVVPWLHLQVTSRSVGPIERFIPDAG